MERDANIVLVGFMGTGKTTVGRRLAETLGRPFIDMDVAIEERAGRTISSLFAEEGEAAFRRLERALAHELSGHRGLVVAAGGGAVLDPENLRDFSATGLVACLKATPEAVLRRVEQETHRPLLERGAKARRIVELLEQRRPIYEAIPFGIDTTDLAPEEVARRILARFAEG